VAWLVEGNALPDDRVTRQHGLGARNQHIALFERFVGIEFRNRRCRSCMVFNTIIMPGNAAQGPVLLGEKILTMEK